MLNKIRRELERRRKAITVAKGAFVKKSAAALPPPRQISSVSSAGTATLKLATAATKVSTPTTHPKAGAETEYIKKPSSTRIQPSSFSTGMIVKVRGPAKTLRTGQRLFILHHAVVISDVEGGYLEVKYHGNYPRPGVVRIAMDQVKTMAPPTK
jgi:hypothetical protein